MHAARNELTWTAFQPKNKLQTQQNQETVK